MHAQQPPTTPAPSVTCALHPDGCYAALHPAEPEPTKEQARYQRLSDCLTTAVRDLNAALGYLGAWDEPKITIGYIGNSGPGFDDRQHHVFLPHPGRVGTYADQVGSWATGDAEGLRDALVEVRAMVKIVKHLTEQRLLAGWSTRA